MGSGYVVSYPKYFAKKQEWSKHFSTTIVTDHQPAQPLDFVVNFPKVGDKRQRCKLCLSEIFGPDQKKSKDKLPKIRQYVRNVGKHVVQEVI